MLRHCGSIDTISSYQRVTKQRDSLDRTEKNVRKGSRCRSHNRRPVEGLGRYLSESPDAPKMMGMSSRRASTRKEEPPSAPQSEVSIVGLFVRYEEVMTLSATPTTVKELYPTFQYAQRATAYSPSTKRIVSQHQPL